MPIIPANVINGVFYLYRTVEDATAGRDPGGTGWELRERKRTTARVPEAHVTGDERYIRGMSGMTCAIPAWEILEVLDIDELKTAREQLAAVDQNGRKPQPETVSGGSRSENP